jgi:hypothetical protein
LLGFILAAMGVLCPPDEEKRFFFAKKNQKTFAP